MDAVISSFSAPQVAPVLQADVRPTADAAALAKDPSPTPSMAIPASLGQSGVVTETRLADSARTLSGLEPPERVLKPWGVAMLPERAQSERQIAAAEDAAEEAEAESAEEARSGDADEATAAPREDNSREAREAPRTEPAGAVDRTGPVGRDDTRAETAGRREDRGDA